MPKRSLRIAARTNRETSARPDVPSAFSPIAISHTAFSPALQLSAADAWEMRRYESLTTAIVRIALVLVGFDYVVFRGAAAGLLIALGLLPLWLHIVPRYSLAPAICMLAFLSIPSGYLLAHNSSFDHKVDSIAQASWFWLLLSGIAALVLILWARTRLPLHEIVLLYGIGSLADAWLFSNRTWKFDLAVPLILIVLAIAERYKKPLLSVFLVLGMGLISVLNDGRSLFGFCAIAAMLTLWQIRGASGKDDRPRNHWRPVALIVAVAVGLYLLVSSLLTAGVFGPELQQRSTAQIEASGSLIAGGRPEWSATRELVKLRPLGYGTGVVPSWPDLQAGKAGFSSINIAADGYIERFLLGSGFELHSIVADLWVSFGLVGAALGLLMILALVRSMAFLLAERAAPTSVLFACTLGVWYLLFGTIYGNWLEVCAAIGFSLVPRLGAGPGPGLGQGEMAEDGTAEADTKNYTRGAGTRLNR